MKYIYILREYAKAAVECLKYIYKFDKKGTILRLAIFIAFPIIANGLSIANAMLIDGLQKSFGTGIISLVVPAFLFVILLELIEESVTYVRRIVSATWRAKMSLFIDLARYNKKKEFSVPFVDSRDFSRIQERINNTGGQNAQLSLLLSIPDFIKMAINIVFAIIVIGQFNYIFSIIVIIASLPSFYSSFQQILSIDKLRDETMDFVRYTYVYSRPFTNGTELKDGKLSSSLNKFLNIFESRRYESLGLWQKLYTKYAHKAFLYNVLGLVVGYAAQFLIIKDVVHGYVLIGQGVLLISQINKLQGAIGELSGFLPDQYQNTVAVRYISLYLNTKENTENTTGAEIDFSQDAIEFKDVTFSYPIIKMQSMDELTKEIHHTSQKYFGLEPTIDDTEEDKQNDFNLSIPHLVIQKGEHVAIVGKNGNGKTTFLQLLMSLYKPEQGTIRMFGTDISQAQNSSVYNALSVLFQDYSANDLKTHEYIALSEIDNPDMDRVRTAAKLATADGFIEKWKDGYTQQLGVSFKGVKPSKGQWQKLALARTFYKNAPIIILDEPTAAIDAISAKKIFENISKIDPSKIVLFVCHNISDIPLAATRVLVFDQGKIIGDGTHKDLLKSCELYKELYQSEVGS